MKTKRCLAGIMAISVLASAACSAPVFADEVTDYPVSSFAMVESVTSEINGSDTVNQYEALIMLNTFIEKNALNASAELCPMKPQIKFYFEDYDFGREVIHAMQDYYYERLDEYKANNVMLSSGTQHYYGKGSMAAAGLHSENLLTPPAKENPVYDFYCALYEVMVAYITEHEIPACVVVEDTAAYCPPINITLGGDYSANSAAMKQISAFMEENGISQELVTFPFTDTYEEPFSRYRVAEMLREFIKDNSLHGAVYTSQPEIEMYLECEESCYKEIYKVVNQFMEDNDDYNMYNCLDCNLENQIYKDGGLAGQELTSVNQVTSQDASYLAYKEYMELYTLLTSYITEHQLPARVTLRKANENSSPVTVRLHVILPYEIEEGQPLDELCDARRYNVMVNEFLTKNGIPLDMVNFYFDGYAVKYGDALCDGSVEVSDAIAISKSVLGCQELTEEGRINSDMDNDGCITASDASYLIKCLAGIQSFPEVPAIAE